MIYKTLLFDPGFNALGLSFGGELRADKALGTAGRGGC